MNYEELKLRSDEWYDDMDVNYQLGRSLHALYNEHGKPYLMLDDGLRLEYDTVLCATGTSEVLRNIPGIVFMFRTL